MNRKTALVLSLTFCALVAATVWVPVSHVWYSTGVEPPTFVWVWDYVRYGAAPPILTHDGVFIGSWGTAHVYWGRYALQLALPLALGGLLALFFRTRAARAA